MSLQVYFYRSVVLYFVSLCVSLRTSLSPSCVFFPAREVIREEDMGDFDCAIHSTRTRELVRSRTAATKSAEIRQLRKAADLLETSSFQSAIDNESSGQSEPSFSDTNRSHTASSEQIEASNSGERSERHSPDMETPLHARGAMSSGRIVPPLADSTHLDMSAALSPRRVLKELQVQSGGDPHVQANPCLPGISSFVNRASVDPAGRKLAGARFL